MSTLKGIIFVLIGFVAVQGQENAQTRIPDSLLECYQNHFLLQKENLLPSSMTVLIDLIRKIENTPTGNNMDMRSIAIGLIHRFRLDGIVKASNIAESSDVLPYSPKGFQFNKHKIVLSRLIPPNQMQFPNESLTDVERCSLHHMMSSSIFEQIRGDEGTVCNKLSQYRTQRLPRQVRQSSEVEVLDQKEVDKINIMGQMKMTDADDEVSSDVFPGIYGRGSDIPTSQCPVEDGVVYTQWGTVSVGPLLAGIATGLERQIVNLRELSSISQRATLNSTSPANVKIDNLFAATLAGDLAEVALVQGPFNKNSLVTGASGAWNSTQNPKWYFLSQSSNNEITDAEIRGGLDGLILGLNVDSFVKRTATMKLSQLLDMYYSQSGVFSDKIRACNRREVMKEFIQSDTLREQVFGFSYVLDQSVQLQATIKESGFRTYSSNAVDSLNDYIPKSLNDLSCSASATTDDKGYVEISSNIYIVMDTSISYFEVRPSVAHIVNGLNISPVGSNVTLLSGKEGKIMCNSTSSLATFDQCYNWTTHDLTPRGVDLPKIIASVKDLHRSLLNNESLSGWAGGKSSIVIIIAGLSEISDSDLSYTSEQLKYIYEEIPDLRFLYLTSLSKEKLNSVVKDPSKDILPISFSGSENTILQVNDLLKRIKDEPQRLINPRCGADYKQSDSGNSVVYGYVSPKKVNFYRLHPNYFFRPDSSASVKIQGLGYGSLTVCQSRNVQLPRANSTTGNEGVTCTQVTTNTMEISLSDACADAPYIHKCNPLYISVEAGESQDSSSSPRCTERLCRYPDMVKYTVTLQQLGCFSGAKQIVFNMTLLVISLALAFKSLL